MGLAIGGSVPGPEYTDSEDGRILASGEALTDPGGWLPLEVGPLPPASNGGHVESVRLRLIVGEHGARSMEIEEVLVAGRSESVSAFVAAAGVGHLGAVIEATHHALAHRARRAVPTRPLRTIGPRAASKP